MPRRTACCVGEAGSGPWCTQTVHARPPFTVTHTHTVYHVYTQRVSVARRCPARGDGTPHLGRGVRKWRTKNEDGNNEQPRSLRHGCHDAKAAQAHKTLREAPGTTRCSTPRHCERTKYCHFAPSEAWRWPPRSQHRWKIARRMFALRRRNRERSKHWHSLCQSLHQRRSNHEATGCRRPALRHVEHYGSNGMSSTPRSTAGTCEGGKTAVPPAATTAPASN